MNQHRRPIAIGVMVAVLAAGLAPAADAWAADSDVQELRREIGRLRAETQALQDAIAQTTEMERQRSANLIRAMKADAPPAQPAAPPPAAPAPAGEANEARQAAAPAAPSARGDEKRRSKSRHRRHRRSGRHHSKGARAQADAADR
jgi:hypothetical protein